MKDIADASQGQGSEQRYRCMAYYLLKMQISHLKIHQKHLFHYTKTIIRLICRQNNLKVAQLPFS